MKMCYSSEELLEWEKLEDKNKALSEENRALKEKLNYIREVVKR